MYDTDLNGITITASSEPYLQNEIVFRLPRSLNLNDEIEIAGNIIPHPKRLFLNLTTGTSSPDYQDMFYQLDVDFLSEEIKLRCIENEKGWIQKSDQTPSQLFPDSEFKFIIRTRGDEHQVALDITIGISLVGTIYLKDDMQNITFFTLSGDETKVKDLMFRYA